jgi:predicted metalloprotease with PDZ domain
MKSHLPLLLALLAPASTPPALKPNIQYTLRVDSADLSGWDVEIRLRNVPDTFRLAMAAHPEYDDRYWRYVTGFTVESSSGTATVTKLDNAVWQVIVPRGEVRVGYRIALPPPAPLPRASWRPFLTPTGGLVGGPHAFMYLVGFERLSAQVTLDLPAGWTIATGLVPTHDLQASSPLAPTGRGRQGVRTFTAANADALVDGPILAGRLRQWSFAVNGVPHRVVYWPLADATPFDTSAFVSGIHRMAQQAFALFGRAPYRTYTFLFQDGAYGGLEHHTSVTLGARSTELARDPNTVLQETAHEFVHTWNLLAIRPVEYRAVDYRTQPPVAGLWFSEGLTLFYADLLLRRAGVSLNDSTRAAHVERLLSRYLANPAYARFSAEAVSRVAYNAEPGALGDYSASTHLQGELIGTMLDLLVRDATRGRRSMDDVMRLLFERSNGSAGVDGRAIEQAVETVCGCDVTPFFDAHVRGGARIDFDRYLGLIGLKTQVSSAPAVFNGEPERDLRIFGWEREGEGGVRLIITDPASLWGRAGLHSGDKLVAMDGAQVTTWPELRARLQRLRMGDTVRVEVQRPSGPFATTVRVSGFERPTVRIIPAPNATAAQQRLATAWQSGEP